MERNQFVLDARIISVILLAVIVVMFILWKPWAATTKETITVTGKSIVSESPDQFVFSPSYKKTAATQQQAIEDVSVVGNDVVAKLKELGVADKDIKTNVTNYQDYSIDIAPVPAPTKTATGYSAQYTITATVRSQEPVQTIVDYLATTPVEYAVTPSADFSEALKNRLESEARTAALKDAKTKAEETVKTLGLRLGKVASISESNPFGGPIYYDRATVGIAEDTKAVSPSYSPGENDYTFQVTVIYQIK